MALIKCPECEKDVSTEAVTCPHCGYPLKKDETNEPKYEQKTIKLFCPFGQYQLKNKLQPYIDDKWEVCSMVMDNFWTTNYIVVLRRKI